MTPAGLVKRDNERFSWLWADGHEHAFARETPELFIVALGKIPFHNAEAFMLRREVLTALAGLGLTTLLPVRAMASHGSIEKIELNEGQWRERLSEGEYRILRKEGTEPAGSSDLLNEKRSGTYVCAGCGLALFHSETKFDSGTGWPSFYDAIDGHVETKWDFKMLLPRTEYHCARCGGHQGHVFEDGPEPTGLRYCNNGLALDFEPAE